MINPTLLLTELFLPPQILLPGQILPRAGQVVPGWFKSCHYRLRQVTQQGITSDTIINVSGGTDKIKAYGSFGYLNNKGTIKGQSYERYSAKANVDITATNWLSF